MLLFLLLSLGAGGRSWSHELPLSCPTNLYKPPEGEVFISQLVGETVVGPANPDSGTVYATKCLFQLVEERESVLAGANSYVSNALLAVLTLDPTRWFEAASEVDPIVFNKWLYLRIRSSELQGIGKCVERDRFYQAKVAIDSLRLEIPSQEKIRVRVLEVLQGLKCREAEGM